MKTHHLANVILAIVLLTAVAGLYYMYTGAGMAIQRPIVTVDSLGSCCCQGQTGIFEVPASVLSTDENLESDCISKCREHGSTANPVFPLGAC